MANYIPISTVTVGSGGAATIDFTNIPQTYTDLIIKTSIRTTRTSNSLDILFVTINGLTTNQTARYIYGDGTGPASGTDTRIWSLNATTDAATASTFGNSELIIPNYTSSNNKSMSVDGVSENNASSAYAAMTAGLWSSTAPITSLSFASSTSSTIKQYSTATLYGIRKY